MRPVLIHRPEPGASATFERAVELGLNPVKLPLFEIEPLHWAVPDDLAAFDGLLVTSANAIGCGGETLERLKKLPVFAVGPATAAVAREAGFVVAKIGRAGLGALLRSINPDLKLLHLAGEDRIDPRRVWQKITAVPVYRAEMIDPVETAGIDGSICLIHSPRAGARLAEVAPDRSSVAIAAISRNAAEACGNGWQTVSAAQQPDDMALLALAARLCEKNDA